MVTKRRGKGEGSIFYDSSKKRWVAEVTLPDGKRKKKRAVNKKDVSDWLLEQRKLISEGLLVKDVKDTLGSYLRSYMDNVAVHSLRPSTLHSYNKWINNHINPAIGHIKLTALKPRDLENYYSLKLKQGMAKSTVRYMHAIIRKALNHAVKQRTLIRNPTDAVTPPRPERKEFRTLTADELRCFFAVIDSPRWKTLYLVAALLGLRKSEVSGLRWSDIDFERSTISINHIVYEIDGVIHEGTPKTEKSRRTLTMPKVVADQLKSYQLEKDETEGLIFTTRSGRPISQRNITRNFHQTLEKAELPQMRFHDLRHTAATLLLKENIHPKIVQNLLGHSSISLTMDTYSHIIQGINNEAAEKMNTLFKDT